MANCIRRIEKKTPPDYIQRLVNLMSRRCDAVIIAKGMATKYYLLIKIITTFHLRELLTYPPSQNRVKHAG